MKQAKATEGFIKMSNRGFLKDHYTLSAWENEPSMRSFARSGEHQIAMKSSKSLAEIIATYTYESSEFPSWDMAKKEVKEKGKVLNF